MESFIIWTTVIVLGTALVVGYVRRFARSNTTATAQHGEAVASGTDRPPTQHPQIDDVACIGCGACVDACPEGDVLAVANGRAVLVNGMRCVGHGLCAEACPVGALQVGLGDTSARTDLPLLDDGNQTSVPGLYVAGELSGFALIRNAVQQGCHVADRVAKSLRGEGSGDGGDADLIVVGAGPAGLSAALRAREHGISVIVLDAEEAGGTILQYPRRKLVMTRPVDIPLYGRLEREQYEKEELLEIWQDIPRRFDLDLRPGHRVTGVEPVAGGLVVHVGERTLRARRVLLAMGRRGNPRRLGVPGEDLPKVAYRLLDAASYENRDVLVVGGGDSAIEAAVALAFQGSNRVALSYRRPDFVRIRARNEERIRPLLASGAIRGLFESQVTAITERAVRLDVKGETVEIPNDDVFIFAGGEPPFAMMRKIGIAFGGERAA
jgi:thioredoxin reductase/Pyruvate/2-oxoacid:ferredoxin oxidoreductase delta subunit